MTIRTAAAQPLTWDHLYAQLFGYGWEEFCEERIDVLSDDEREVASEHMFGVVYGATYGMSAHDKGDEEEGRVCYTCQTRDW